MGAVAGQGWSHIPGLLTVEVAAALCEERPTPMCFEQAPEDSPVQFLSSTSGALLTEDKPRLRALASALAQTLHEAALAQALPAVPAFTEGTWCLYPAGAGFISAHRDPVNAVGVVATLTLRGSAVFRVHDDTGEREIVVDGGDLVLLRGGSWPSQGAPRPVHSADPPGRGERMILTLRCNADGPWSPWRY
jgi:hypothetical protein